MKDIKVVFKGGNAPSGKTSGVEYMCGAARLKAWEKSGKFQMDVEKPKAKAVEKPKAKAVEKPVKKKASKKEKE